MLWDLPCQNGRVGNSSLSFIVFVGVKLPSPSHIHSRIQFPPLSIHQWVHFVSADFIPAAAIVPESRGAQPPANGETVKWCLEKHVSERLSAQSPPTTLHSYVASMQNIQGSTRISIHIGLCILQLRTRTAGRTNETLMGGFLTTWDILAMISL